MLKFGLINFLENPAGRSEQQIAEEQKYILIGAEEYGFDSIWQVEHHFSDYGHCVSAAVMLATLASASRRVRLGSGVVVLPFHNPIRVAEEFALIDLLSDGRLEFGIGRGFQPTEFRGYGVDQTKSREIFDEALEVILQAWTSERVNFAGAHFKFNDVMVKPKPLQKPHPPIWMAAVSPQSFVSAGARGFNLICGPIFGPTGDYLEGNLCAYRESLRSHGHDPASRQIAMLAMVYVAANEAKAEADFSESAVWCYRALSKSADSSLGASPVPSYEYYTALRNASDANWEAIRGSDAAIWGTPERCIERIAELERRFGFTTLLCWTRVGSIDDRKVRDSMGLMQEQVIPYFKRQAA